MDVTNTFYGHCRCDFFAQKRANLEGQGYEVEVLEFFRDADQGKHLYFSYTKVEEQVAQLRCVMSGHCRQDAWIEKKTTLEAQGFSPQVADVFKNMAGKVFFCYDVYAI